MRSRTVLLSAVLLVGTGVAVGFLKGPPTWIDPFAARAFSAPAWATATPEGRASMARDVIRRLPKCTPETQVVALLGKPSQVVPPGEGGNHAVGARAYKYFIGCWEYRGMDSAFVYVHLDANDRVIKADIYGY